VVHSNGAPQSVQSSAVVPGLAAVDSEGAVEGSAVAGAEGADDVPVDAEADGTPVGAADGDALPVVGAVVGAADGADEGAIVGSGPSVGSDEEAGVLVPQAAVTIVKVTRSAASRPPLVMARGRPGWITD